MKIPGCRYERERRGLSAAALSQRSGVAENTIRNAEAGADVMEKTAAKIARALEEVPPLAVMGALTGEGR